MREVSDKVFKRELEMCKQLSEEGKGGCNWGKCKDCGVVPFLYKLHKGELIEDPEEIKKIKEKTVKVK